MQRYQETRYSKKLKNSKNQRIPDGSTTLGKAGTKNQNDVYWLQELAGVIEYKDDGNYKKVGGYFFAHR